MKLIAQLKLLPTPQQADGLKHTLERANAACESISRTAWTTKTFKQFDLHRLCYPDVRETFGLASQLAVRCISKVADAYKLDRKCRRSFKPTGSMAYDDRILSWNLKEPSVSIWTLAGRQSIPFVCGERQWTLLETRHGETDLAYVGGAFYLLAVCDVEPPEPIDVEGTLGVDLGITNIAVDSDGTIHSGSAITCVRYRHRRLRTKLQRKGTLSAKRRLRRLSGQEARFARDVNHVISKRLVQATKRTNRRIALEKLTHIQSRVRARKSQRPVLTSWSFAQLQAMVVYKAALAGVPVVFVDPRNTSRTCPSCGHIDKANRKSQAQFLCTSCSFAGNADVIAAGNIASRAAVNRPYVSETAGPSRQRQAHLL